MQEFDGCALKRTATQLVFADGVPGSRIMFVGEAPGGGEDRSGRPFVGRAGQLLDRMLRTHWIGARECVHRERGSMATPGQPNADCPRKHKYVCLSSSGRSTSPILNILVCLGGSASRAMLGVQGGIMRARGSWFPYIASNRPRDQALAMLHPAFLLRQPAHKRFAWMDMRALASELKLHLTESAKDGPKWFCRSCQTFLTSSPASALSISLRVSSNP